MNEGSLSAGGTRPILFGAGLLLAAVVAACSEPATPVDAGAPPVAQPPPVAQLSKVAGDVKLERKGQQQPAQLGYLYSKDALETGADAEAVVRFSGGREVEVGPDARLVLEAGESGLVLNVDKGLVLTRVPQGAAPQGEGLALSIATPFGLTRVGKSELSVDVGQDGARLEVKVGEVEFVAKDGQVTKAGAGETKSFGAGTRQIELPPMKLVLTAQGRVDVKKKDTKAFAPVSLRKPLEVGEGDEVRVRDGRASLALGTGSELTFQRGADAVLGPSTSGGGAESNALTLSKGQVSAVLDPKQRSTLALGDVTLSADQGAQVSVAKSGDGYQLEVLAGEVNVAREGEAPQAVEGGSVARISKKKVEVSQVPREQLVLPTRYGQKVLHDGGLKVTLQWEGEPDKAYRVEVANDPSFSHPLIAGKMKQHYLSLLPPSRGNLFWRVLDGDKEVDKGSAYFSPEPKSGELDANRNQVLDGADKTTIFFQDRPPSVTFICKADPKAARYKVSVYKEGELSKPVAEVTGEGEKVALKEGALSEGRYLWSATPLDSAGTALSGGKMNKLEITYDNAVPNLIIKSPRNGDPYQASVPVKGIAPVGAKVFVNGKAVALDDKARFDTTASPLPGGRMVFRMSKGGSEVYTVRTLRSGR